MTELKHPRKMKKLSELLKENDYHLTDNEVKVLNTLLSQGYFDWSNDYFEYKMHELWYPSNKPFMGYIPDNLEGGKQQSWIDTTNSLIRKGIIRVVYEDDIPAYYSNVVFDILVDLSLKGEKHEKQR